MQFLKLNAERQGWKRYIAGIPLSFLSVLAVQFPSVSAPATKSEVSAYTDIGAMTICFLNALDVSFDKAMQASSTSVMRTLVDRHDAAIEEESLSRLPTEDELRDAIVVQLSIRTEELCGDKFSGSNKKELDRVLDIIKHRFSSGKQT